MKAKIVVVLIAVMMTAFFVILSIAKQTKHADNSDLQLEDISAYLGERFNDIGGMITKKKGRIRHGRIYQAAFPPNTLPKSDTLEHFKLFLDYRLDDESPLARNIFAQSGPTKLIRLRFWAYPTRREADRHWHSERPEIFAKAIRQSSDEIRRTFVLLADEKHYPVLYGCSYGHHRSMMIRALLYRALGVSEKTILAAIDEPFFISPEDSLKVMLETVFAEIQKSGGIDKYLKKIKVSKRDLTKFRQIMVLD